MKLFKVIFHQKNYSEESLLINPKDYPDLSPGSVVEIVSQDRETRFLLQVNSFPVDVAYKDNTISIEQSVAAIFHLKQYAEVCVNVVNPKDVSLDSVELTFKDQYLARSDMWRFKKCLVGTCLYLNKKPEYYGIRCQVLEMYTQGEKVASGVVTEDTKIVYRSCSSMVYIFIQMSCEMWHFDINGDLYFEKAINGFLPELFSKWKKLNCNHDVTIVFFSRTFYEAQSSEEFPEYMQECLQQDYKKRFFEDFYRVAVQNERYDDWGSTVILLKKLFNQYQKAILDYHRRPGHSVPPAVNSTASQGNFLEVLNMSLNVFEKHFMDRSFDRTGQLSIVISPGVGVFEVDRELTLITKQRIIDNGIGSDLVCLGEQPLHAVPLFKFHNKCSGNTPALVDDYNMPHWINLSFYSSCEHSGVHNFVPRVKLPTSLPEAGKKKDRGMNYSRSRHASQPDPSFPDVFDYDEYDSQVFKMPARTQSARNTNSLQRPGRSKEISSNNSQGTSSQNICEDSMPKFTQSDPLPLSSASHACSAAIAIPNRGSHRNVFTSLQSSVDGGENPQQMPCSKEDVDSDFSPPVRPVVGSAGSSYESPLYKQLLFRQPKPLVNPFDPSHITIKLTSNRRRWTHVFPLACHMVLPNPLCETILPGRAFNSSLRISSSVQLSGPQSDPSLSWLWGATGEQEWTPALTTGVDWKSLVIPACLPITTDYFPDKRSLQNDYVLSYYYLHPQDIIAENTPSRCYRNDDESKFRSMTTIEVYNELICQRLQQGFQIILLPKQHPSYPHTEVSSSPQFATSSLKSDQKVEQLEEYLLSIGRIFHRLTLNGPEITVTQYRPRFPYRETEIHYCYRFHAPDSDTYGVSWVDFTSEKLENYNWNYLDHYICMKGEGEFELKDSLKYWRLRMLLLPGAHSATRLILDGSDHCDLYCDFSAEVKIQQKEGFLKFVEVMNKIRRLSNRKPKSATSPAPRRSSLGQTMLLNRSSAMLPSSSFRDRVSSNRIHDRPRLRSHSAKMGARPDPPVIPGRVSPATEADGKLASNLSLEVQVEGDVNNDNLPAEKTLTENSSEAEIMEAMKHAQDGLNFIMKPGLPNFTFISGEAVSWILENVVGMNTEHQAIHTLQNMVQNGGICHASGVKSHPFIHGFYLYYIVSANDKATVRMLCNEEESIYLFQREYLEVELSPSLPLSPVSLSYVFPADEDFWKSSQDKFNYRCTNIEIDGTKSGRLEWGQARYQSIFEPYEAFEIVVEWMVATGNIVAELVQSWARKSTSHGLQLVPIPSDPFALPFSADSDPLRGPIFIALDLSCFMDTIVQSMDEQGLFALQEKILCKFGFIPYCSHNPSNPPQYVHISGSMFVMIPLQKESARHTTKSSMQAMDLSQISSPHDEYITRHYSGPETKEMRLMKSECDTRIGFLWSWNYMITKRWKNAGTVDENFMRKVMRDFRAFCSNQEGRLEDFYKCSLLANFSHDTSILLSLES